MLWTFIEVQMHCHGALSTWDAPPQSDPAKRRTTGPFSDCTSHVLAMPDYADREELSSADLDPVARHGYPRPQLRRRTWISLNGPWEFALDHAGRYALPRDVLWDRTIVVPFSPETSRSGIHDTGFYKACWYRRLIDVPALHNGERLLLHFGAVDYTATVWVDGALACSHEGGYTPFTVDLTDFMSPGTGCEIVVRAEDDPADLTKPRGQAGLAAGTAFDLVSADHGHLADRVDGARAAHANRRGAMVTRASNDGTSASRRRSLENGATACASASGWKCPAVDRRRRYLYADLDRDRAADRALRPGHRRLAQRAALEPRVTDADHGPAAALGRPRRAAR